MCAHMKNERYLELDETDVQSNHSVIILDTPQQRQPETYTRRCIPLSPKCKMLLVTTTLFIALSVILLAAALGLELALMPNTMHIKNSKTMCNCTVNYCSVTNTGPACYVHVNYDNGTDESDVYVNKNVENGPCACYYWKGRFLELKRPGLGGQIFYFVFIACLWFGLQCMLCIVYFDANVEVKTSKTET